jgi:hypothetical protein
MKKKRNLSEEAETIFERFLGIWVSDTLWSETQAEREPISAIIESFFIQLGMG